MWQRISGYLNRFNRSAPSPSHVIGCILLASPVFFPKDLWIEGPADWSSNIVAGKTYDTRLGEGKRIWEECLIRTTAIPLNQTVMRNVNAIREAPARYGTERLVRPRLGQGTFRYSVEKIYQKCAVTGEHSLPALEAAHIFPYKLGGPHEVTNGLFLRADVHKLFDRGYVTVTPDYEFKVSRNLKEEFQNGKVYYELENRKIWLPNDQADCPDRNYLEFHNSEVFEKF